MELHERLGAARRHAGFATAVDAAAALGCPYPTYAGHENGSSGFKHKTAAVYARRFGVSLEWLLTERGPMVASGPSADEAEYLDLYHQVDEEVQKSVVAILRHARKRGEPEEPPAANPKKPPSNRK